MGFDFAAVKAQVRGIVHDTLAIDASYLDPETVAPVPLRIRWHSKLTQFGDMESGGYSTVLEGINRIIFDRGELAFRGVTIQRGGKLTITSPQFNNAVLLIDARDELAGPLEEIWLAAKV